MDNIHEGKPTTRSWQAHLEAAEPVIIKATQLILLTLFALKLIVHEIKSWQ